MEKLKAKQTELKKLSQNTYRVTSESLHKKRANTDCDKRIYRVADPHIQQRKVKGRTFYTYRRGTDKEIYLGSADYILAAVQEKRGKDNYQGGTG